MIIDRTGKPLFDSVYYYISSYGGYYEAWGKDAGGKKTNTYFDSQGNEILFLPSRYQPKFVRGFFPAQKRIVFEQDDKYGLRSFDGKILLEPHYTLFIYYRPGLFYVNRHGRKDFADGDNLGLLDMDGGSILPLVYSGISIENDLVIARDDSGSTLFKIVEKEKGVY
jgi:hypothetical protein